MKTTLGIQQQDSGLRRAALIIHSSLVDKQHRVNIHKAWPLPFDVEHEENQNKIFRLKQKQLELKQ